LSAFQVYRRWIEIEISCK